MTNNEVIVLGGGCFWCTEAVFKMLKGVVSVVPGYAGGDTDNPTYDQVSGGKTGHAECTKIEFDSEKVSLDDLLTVFFASHDPTTLNRQGADVGTQYRSVIFYSLPEQKPVIEKFIAGINNSNELGSPIVTAVQPLEIFYPAESYHKDYYERNKDAAYCELVINPKLEKVQRKFAELIHSRS
jgi:peptide-methionine (S)-S-oxide reductase